MSIGIYGNIRPADVNIEDIDMFYTYAADRETEVLETIRLDPLEIIQEHTIPNDESNPNTSDLLEGLYNLNLPATIFNRIGIYNIFIKPKSYKIQITDCGVLSALPNVKGLVINSNDLPSNLQPNNGLQGFRIEYYNQSDNSKIRNTSRYIVTSNKVSPINENIGNTSQKSVRYRFDDTGNLIFLQVSPSSSSSLKPNLSPFIGSAGQYLSISNTYFNPIMLELELVENDIDTLVNFIGGNQIKDVDNGLLTYYDNDDEIFRQYQLYEIKEELGDVSLYEVKERKDNIDTSQDFDSITNSIE